MLSTVPRPLPRWEALKEAAPGHVDPAPPLIEKASGKFGNDHTAVRLECVCGHKTVWSATQADAISKWMNHLCAFYFHENCSTSYRLPL